MKRFAPIKYRDFYDRPRIFLAECGNHLFLFDCPFNQSTEEYEDRYKIYLMPQLNDEELKGSWEVLTEKAIKPIGQVSVSEVKFDGTFREQVDLAVLSRFGF